MTSNPQGTKTKNLCQPAKPPKDHNSPEADKLETVQFSYINILLFVFSS